MRATQVCPEPGLLRLRGGAFVRQAGEPDFHLLPESAKSNFLAAERNRSTMSRRSSVACWRPSNKPVVWYKSSLNQAASWETARRVVAKVEFHFGELFPRVGFIVTNLETDSREVVRFWGEIRQGRPMAPASTTH